MKFFEVLGEFKLKHDALQWQSCFSCSSYSTAREQEISKEFLILAQFPPLPSCRVILMLTTASCMKLQIFLLCRSLSAVPKPAADLAF